VTADLDGHAETGDRRGPADPPRYLVTPPCQRRHPGAILWVSCVPHR